MTTNHEKPVFCGSYNLLRKSYKGDFQKVSSACEQAPPTMRGPCFYSMGRDVDGQIPRNPQKEFEYCSYTKDQQLHEFCLMGAVQNKFWEASGAEDALDFCKLLKSVADKNACYGKIINQARQVLMTRQEFDSFCGKVEPGYHYRVPTALLMRYTAEKLFGVKPNAQTKSLDSCHRILPQWDHLWAKP